MPSFGKTYQPILSDYQLKSGKNAASGYAGLTASTLLALAQVPATIVRKIAATNSGGVKPAAATPTNLASVVIAENTYATVIFLLRYKSLNDGTGADTAEISVATANNSSDNAYGLKVSTAANDVPVIGGAVDVVQAGLISQGTLQAGLTLYINCISGNGRVTFTLSECEVLAVI